jgi:cell division protease FtsH
MYGRWLRNSFIYLLILVAIVAIVYTVISGNGSEKVDQTQGEFVTQVKAGLIDEVDVNGDKITYKLTDGGDTEYETKLEKNVSVTTLLQNEGVAVSEQPAINIKEAGTWSRVLSIGLTFLPVLIIVAFLLFLLRQTQGGNQQAMNFGKSKARMFSGTRPSVTFLDVAGVEEAKDELKEVVEFLEVPREVRGPRRAHPQGCAAGRASRYRQDASRQGCGRRGRRAVLLDLRL